MDLAGRARAPGAAHPLDRGLRPIPGRTRRTLGRLRPPHGRGLAGHPRRPATIRPPPQPSRHRRTHPRARHPPRRGAGPARHRRHRPLHRRRHHLPARRSRRPPGRQAHPVAASRLDGIPPAVPRSPYYAMEAEQRVAAWPVREADVFVHGDLWQGNALWVGDALTGLIDCAGAGAGPAGVDLGSLRCDAAVRFHLDAADEVQRAWEEAAGRPAVDGAYWDVVAAWTAPPADGSSPCTLPPAPSRHAIVSDGTSPAASVSLG